MRASLLLLVLLVCTVKFLTGCKKEPELDRPTAPVDFFAKGGPSPCAEGLNLACGMPHYLNAEHFDYVYGCLETAYENHQDDFETAYGYLDEDDYEDMIVSLGWVDEQPLIDFESTTNFTSYRKHFVGLEDAWLAAGASGPNPWLDDVFVDEVLATMFNQDGAAMVGDTIVYYAPDGTIYHIPAANEDCSLYECILVNPENCDMEGVQVVDKAATSVCGELYAAEDSTEFYFNEGERRVDWKLKHNRVGGIEDRFIYRSEIRAYRKKNGNWKKWRTKLGVNLYGTAFHFDISICKEDDDTPLTQTPKRRKTRTNKRKFFPSDVDFAVTDEILQTKFHFTGNSKEDRLDL